jgi:hypothetical protein
MSGRILWFSAAVLLVLLGAAGNESASARNGGGGGGGGFGRTGRAMVSRGHLSRGALRSDIVGARSIARNLGVQNSSGFGPNGFGFNQNGFGFGSNGFGFGGNGFVRGSQTGIWPFWPYFDTSPIDGAPVANSDPADPFVIVMSGQPDRASERATADAPPDYSYVAGCHAIPNGYHCDLPHNQATP